jgi:carbon monoxide dehydrogenase subunit G
VRWQSRDGNIEVRGTARFLPAGAGSRVDFVEEVRMEMELNRILAGVIRPVAEAMMARGMKGFVERMCGALDSLPG